MRCLAENTGHAAAEERTVRPERRAYAWPRMSFSETGGGLNRCHIGSPSKAAMAK